MITPEEVARLHGQKVLLYRGGRIHPNSPPFHGRFYNFPPTPPYVVGRRLRNNTNRTRTLRLDLEKDVVVPQPPGFRDYTQFDWWGGRIDSRRR